MDFEKESREIAYGFWCGNCEGPSARPCKKHEGCYELIIEIKEALLRAHRQGQEEMRERSAKEGRKMGLHYACLSFESTERVVGASNATARIETAIRSLPLTPIEEDKSVAT